MTSRPIRQIALTLPRGPLFPPSKWEGRSYGGEKTSLVAWSMSKYTGDDHRVSTTNFIEPAEDLSAAPSSAASPPRALCSTSLVGGGIVA